MRIIILNFLFSFAFFSITADLLPRKAMCMAPVIDMLEYPLGTSDSSSEQVKQAYATIPLSWGPAENDRAICPRIHQLLLHDTVTILDETPFEAYIQIDSCFIADAQHAKQSITGWVLKEHLKDITELEIKKIPAPITWTAGNIDRANIKTVTIFTSFGDADGTIYCAGTRFILNKLINDTFEVYAYSQQDHNFKLITIPQSNCMFETYYYSSEEKQSRACFLLGIWTSIPGHCIPLVWGGTSIGTVSQNDNFTLAEYSIDNETHYGWQRPYRHIGQVYTGVDASGLILRAAQIVGIPYFCRNSKTAAEFLKAIETQDYPETGDIIWIPGALLMINNVNKHTVITAMSYTSGYGAVVELPLAKVFKNINTYYDLSQAYRNHQPLTLLNKDGSEARTVAEFKILKMF